LVQLDPAGRGLVQVVAVLANELAPVPVMVVVAVKVTAAEVEFFSVITCVAALVPTAVDGNVKEDGVIVRPVLAAAPVPERATVCAVLEAESVKAMVAVSAPAALGVKVMV